MRRHAASVAMPVLAVALFATAVDAARLSPGAVPGARGSSLVPASGLFETQVSRLDLDSIRSTDVTPDGPLAASTASAPTRLTGNALVVDFPGPAQPTLPVIVRPLGVLWRWSPPAGSEMRPPTVRVRLIGPTGRSDEISNATHPERGLRAQLVTRRPTLVNGRDGPSWTGEAELHIQAGDLAEPGAYQGRIEITFENS